jgi:Prenyltransferase and squalene oxidase repeat
VNIGPVNIHPDVLDWLLGSDPAIRWQAMRDLTDASAEELAIERARIAREDLGAAILASQQPDGAWRCDGKPAWLTTLFTLQLLRATGIHAADPAVDAAMARLESGVRWNDLECGWELRPPGTGGNTFFEGEEEPCINGGALAIGSYFNRPEKSLAGLLLSQQLADGGWNCEAPKSTCSSFHTTICVLEGLLEYEHAAGSAPEVAAARHRAEEYLLERSLYRRRSTGEVINSEFLELAFPPRYRYDVLRALDYFRAAEAPRDPRMDEAVRHIEGRQQPDGRWLLNRAYDEALAVTTGEQAGQPSRWNTLRALRVLRWYRQ